MYSRIYSLLSKNDIPKAKAAQLAGEILGLIRLKITFSHTGPVPNETTIRISEELKISGNVVIKLN